MAKIVEKYIAELERNLCAGNSTEHTHRSAFKQLIESLNPSLQATNEPRRRTDCGAPDFAILKTRGHLPIGHVEAKDIGVVLEEASKSEQLTRYRKYLPNLLLTDYLNFWWYANGELWGKASLGATDGFGEIHSTPSSQQIVAELLEGFLDQVPEPIQTASELAIRLARLTHMIRDIIIKSFSEHHASETLTDLRKVLAHQLLPNLAEQQQTSQFADLYAQTLTYGLFAARVHHVESRRGDEFKLSNAAIDIPKTNPLLRQLFNAITNLEFEEEPYAGFVNEVVAVLNNALIDKILSAFGSAKTRQDPTLHFYETFLATYDPTLRESRGVYYTPEPVVGYIVRSVDQLLRSKFGIKDGLADTHKIDYHPPQHRGHPDLPPEQSHRTLILDPAAGTGTFLYEVVDVIRQRFRDTKRAGLWSEYVHEHLLPRIYGFELLMAPYAMAHLKLGMQLAAYDMPELERGMFRYGFEDDDRLKIYLTNTLEQTERHVQQTFGSLQRAISAESQQAHLVKRDLPILVVLGNPPYSGISTNQGDWIDGLLKGSIPSRNSQTGKTEYISTASYYHVDGKPLGERKMWLQDDYVKFMRWAQWRLEQTGHGILAFITNHGYLDNPTFRGMRWALMRAFDEIYVLDLHGNTKKKEVAPDGGIDQNVFDIQQGVSIGIFVKTIKKNSTKSVHAKVFHADCWGRRQKKYEWLDHHDIEATKWQRVKPDSPFYLFKPFDKSDIGGYLGWPAINEVMPMNVTGIVTARDHFVIDFDKEPLIDRIQRLRDRSISDEEIRQEYFGGRGSRRYPPGDTRGWKLPEAREKIRSDSGWQSRVKSLLYRPFDTREVYFAPWMVDWPRMDIMPHMWAGVNMGLIYMRQVALGDAYTHFGVSRHPVDNRCFYSNKGIMSFAPLYLYRDVGASDSMVFDYSSVEAHSRVANFDEGYIKDLANSIKMAYCHDGRGDLQTSFGPEDVFAYLYAVFHSPSYREHFEQMLKLDFPRVPPPDDGRYFVSVVKLGYQLLNVHLLEDERVSGGSITFPVVGDNIVEKGYPKYVSPGRIPIKVGKSVLKPDSANGRIYINSRQYFGGVEPEVWDCQVGGYQVCEKWLKDRRGRRLGFDEMSHYAKTCEALDIARSVMNEIDAIVFFDR